MSIIAVYLRKSRGDEADENIEVTLARHEKILNEFAKKNKLIIKKYYKEVVSGESLVSRPQMLQLLEDVENGLYEAVLCMDIDRLGRGGMKDQGIILETFKFADTLIITPEKTYDLKNEFDEEITEFKSFMSRREYKIITKRLRRGLMQSIADGAYVANPPFGYEKTIIDKMPSLKIIPEEASFVKMAFDMYVNQRVGAQTIADTLNNSGAITKRNAKFCRSTVRNLLKNPTYMGKISWNKVTRKKSPTTGISKATYHPCSEWVIYDGKHEAIISEELFWKAEEIRTGKKIPAYNSGVLKNPLSGLIVCSKCGRNLQLQITRRKYPYILCMTKGCTSCVNFYTLESTILEFVKDKWKSLTIDSAKIRPFAGLPLLEAAESEQASLALQRERLLSFLEKGVYTVELFTERMEMLKGKIEENKKLIKSLKEKQQKADNTNKKEAAQRIKNVLDNYHSADVEKKNIMLKSIIDVIYYTREQGGHNPFELKIIFKGL